MAKTRARQPYARRPSPQGQLKPFLDTELANVQRAVPISVARMVVADAAVLAGDDLILADATAGAITVSLGPADRLQFLKVTIKCVNDSGGALTVSGDMGAFSSVQVPSGQSLTVQSDGTVWQVLQQDLTRFNVVQYGASPLGSASDNAAAFQAAAVAAGTDGQLFFPPYTFASDGNLVIYGPVMGDGCLINWSGTGVAIDFAPPYSGTGPIAFIQNEDVQLPFLVNIRKTPAPLTPGWAMTGVAGSIGVRVRHTYNSRVTIPYVEGFESGVMFYGEHDGTDYNNVRLGHIHNNKRNLVFDATPDGWANESVFVGGRLSFDPAEGVNVTGTRQFLILGGTTATDILNNHRFYGVSLESDVPEYHVETHGSDHLWHHCRWETNLESPKFLSNGANAISNTVRNGFGSHNIVFTTANGGSQPRVETRDGLTLAAASNLKAVLALANHDSNASPIIRAYPAGTDLFGASIGTNWVWEFTANTFSGKATGDAPSATRTQTDPTTGFGTFRKLISQIVDSGGRTVPVADGGGTLTLMSGFATGAVLVEDTNTGQSALIWLGTLSAIIAGGSANFSLTPSAVGFFSVYTSGGNLIFENRRGFGTAAVAFLVARLF